MVKGLYQIRIKDSGELVMAYQWARGKYFINSDDHETKYHWDDVDVLKTPED